MGRQLQGIIGLSIAQITLGTLGYCILESGADSVSAVFYRCAIGGALLGMYCFGRGALSSLVQLPARTLALAGLSGALMVGNWVLFFEGIRLTSISVATIAFHVQPFFVILLGAYFFRERLRRVALLWISAALLGLVLATGVNLGASAVDGSYAIGLLCTLAAAVLYALVTIIAKGLEGLKSHQLTLVQCMVGCVLLAPVLPLGPLVVDADQWKWLLVIGAVHTGGVYMVLYDALPKLSTPLVAILLFLYPASAVIVDAVAYQYDIGMGKTIGLALIVVASLGVTFGWGEKRRPRLLL